MKNSEKIILHLCSSDFGSDSKPYQDAGYDVRLITKDIGVENYDPPKNVYGIIANPPCTQFSKAAWKIPKAKRDFEEGMRIVQECLRIIWKAQIQSTGGLKFWSLENPEGYLRQFMGHPALLYQPWQYGETNFMATKRTCLWGYFKKPPFSVIRRSIPARQKTKTFKLNRLFPSGIQNKEWANASKDKRSIASPYFTQAFFKSNP